MYCFGGAMRIPPYAVILIFAASLAQNSYAQQSIAPRDPQAVVILRTSLAKQMGGGSFSDVTLTGTVTRTAGSDQETGQATLRATALGQSRIDMTLPGGNRSEVRDSSEVQPTGGWMGPTGVAYPMAFHNLMTEPACFFPAFVLSRVLSNPNYSISPVSQSVQDGISVDQITVYEQLTIPGDTQDWMARLTQMEIYLDPSTLLPVAIDMNTHPDNNAALDIPVEFRFSGYTPVQGAQVPFHVEKLLNNSVTLDIQISAVNFNTGLTNASFSFQ